MTEPQLRSSSLLLAMVYAALVLYASLYPFEGWRWPPGQDFWALASLPRGVAYDRFDLWSNLLGYLPLGLLLALALRRSGLRALPTWLLCVVLAAALSYACELLQNFLPRRVPSLTDLGLNIAGASVGALLGLALHALGLVRLWHALRERWFTGTGAFALALLLLWPVALLFPQPVPLGVGQVGDRLRDALLGGLADVPWAASVHELLASSGAVPTPLRALPELLIVACGLLAPCLVAYSVMAPGWRRVVIALGALLLAGLGMTVSTWLNFGPLNAWAWLSPAVVRGLGLGLLLALLLVPVARRVAPGLGLVVLTGLVVGVAQAPADPYFAQSLQAWEQGRFVRFHGLAQWVGWLWPYAAMVWLLSRLGTRS